MTHENGVLAISRESFFGSVRQRADSQWHVVYTGTLPLPLHIAYAMCSQTTPAKEKPRFSYDAMAGMYDVAPCSKAIDHSAGIAQKTGVGVTLDEPTAKLHIINPS
jgi:hypothetical protein